MKLNIQWKKVLYGIILIVIGIILAALHFIVAGDGIRDFISSAFTITDEFEQSYDRLN